MSTVRFLFDRLRTITGERRKRARPPRSAKPTIGARIVLGDAGLRLTVPAGLSDAIWIWLLDAGWRVEAYRPDRRHYQEVSRTKVEYLLACDPEVRARLLDLGDQAWEQPKLEFPASPRAPFDAPYPSQTSGRVRFLKATELNGDRASGVPGPTS